MWCGYHFIHSDVALLEAGGSWAWIIENGQYCNQSDSIDTNWYTNGSLHKGCFRIIILTAHMMKVIDHIGMSLEEGRI